MPSVRCQEGNSGSGFGGLGRSDVRVLRREVCKRKRRAAPTAGPGVTRTPHRLSAVSGEKMNQSADFENRKSIENGRMTQSPDFPSNPDDCATAGGFRHVLPTPGVYTECMQESLHGGGFSSAS